MKSVALPGATPTRIRSVCRRTRGGPWSGPGPAGEDSPATVAVGAAWMLALAVATGVAESIMARVRLLRVPQLLVGAGVLCALGLLLTFR